MTTNPGTQSLVQTWIALWNGATDLAPRILADGVTTHVARFDGPDTLNGPDALVSWIEETRSLMRDLNFTVELGPFTDGATVVLRWRARGHYRAGFPGATSPSGAPIDFTGIDILRTETGRVAEYWLSADLHVLLAQLGVLAA